MIQNIIVGVIVLIAIAYAAFSMFRSVKPPKGKQNACGGCTGCELRNLKPKETQSGRVNRSTKKEFECISQKML